MSADAGDSDLFDLLDAFGSSDDECASERTDGGGRCTAAEPDAAELIVQKIKALQDQLQEEKRKKGKLLSDNPSASVMSRHSFTGEMSEQPVAQPPPPLRMNMANPPISTLRQEPSASASKGDVQLSRKQGSMRTAAPPERELETHSGLRIKQRTVPSMSLKKMIGDRQMIKAIEIAGKIRTGNGEIAGEWVTIAVLAQKSRTKETRTGKKYCVWTLSDLNRAEVNLYLFDDAYRTHWKESPGAIVGVLNASVMPDRNGKHSNGKPCLSIDLGSRLRKLGTATDYGICKAICKDGARCSRAVNLSLGEYCEFHVMSVFKKGISKRMDLNRGSLITSGRSDKRAQRSSKGRATPKLMKSHPTTITPETLARISEKSLYKRTMSAQRAAEPVDGIKGHPVEVLRKNGISKEVYDSARKELESITNIAERHKATSITEAGAALLGCNKNVRPQLGRGLSTSGSVQLNAARARAEAFIKSSGGIKKKEKNVIRVSGSTDDLESRLVTGAFSTSPKAEIHLPGDGGGAKRKRSTLGAAVGCDIDLSTDAGKMILSKRSRHAKQADELKQIDRERRWKEAGDRERMAEKMENIFEQDVVAYKCSNCALLTAYFPKECKNSGHQIKKLTSVKKRWFTCNQCGHHFSTLNKRMPTHPCNKCKRRPPSYTKAPMKKPKRDTGMAPGGGLALKIRGREQKFIGSAIRP